MIDGTNMLTIERWKGEIGKCGRGRGDPNLVGSKGKRGLSSLNRRREIPDYQMTIQKKKRSSINHQKQKKKGGRGGRKRKRKGLIVGGSWRGSWSWGFVRSKSGKKGGKEAKTGGLRF